MEYFNFVIEYLRSELDSDFLTTYRYSAGNYARKYMGLTQVTALVETCPMLMMNDAEKSQIRDFIFRRDISGVMKIVTKYSQQKIYITDFFE
jgi:hypothetical protein